MAFPKNSFILVFLLDCYLRWNAWAKVDMTMKESVEVYLGDIADIPCQFVFNEQARVVMIQWFVRNPGNGSRERIYYRDNTEQKVDDGTEYTGRITVSDIGDQEGVLLTIQDVQLTDEREFFCQVNGMAAGSGEGKTHLRVFDPPEAVIEGVLAGISVTNELPSRIVSCEARNSFSKPNITWYRDSSPLTPTHGQINVVTLVTCESSGFYTVHSELEYKVAKEDKDALFSCEVSYYVPEGLRTARSKVINITVHFPTTIIELWKESPQGLVKEGDTVELRCQGDGNPPPHFTFNREQEQETALEASDDTLVLREVIRGDSGVYQCRSLDLDTYEQVTGDMQLTIHYLDPAVVVPKDSEILLKGESLTATCNALSSIIHYQYIAEGNGVIIVVIILCILLLAILGSVLYFLHKKGKIPCGRSGKQDIIKENPNKDDIVVETKTNTKTEDAGLLKGVNGDKNGPSDQIGSVDRSLGKEDIKLMFGVEAGTRVVDRQLDSCGQGAGDIGGQREGPTSP
ncbi:cell surface glycoprotein MUC18-like [Oncorhynchus clarkii lewisi]|uniref:cell surface glycoprotein MUC18-like n=1 Tax=Oncorhynchus clarkii lewisi TaxID=490388 RepID=UPI0039B9AA90